MSTKTQQAPTLGRVSVWVEISGYHNGGVKIQAYCRVYDVLRGKPVMVEVQLDRYTTSDGKLTDWRAYCPNVHREVSDDATRGAEITAGGKSGEELRERARNTALAWVLTDNYRGHEQDAYADGVRRMMREASVYGEPATRNQREQMNRYAHKMRPEHLDKLTAIFDAFDRYAALMESWNEDTI